jgi:hypothetical protein
LLQTFASRSHGRDGTQAGDAHPGGETMTLALYERAVLMQDLPKI